MRSDKYNEETKKAPASEKKAGRIIGRVILVIFLLLLVVCGATGYRAYTVERFVRDVSINGVPVGGMTVPEAKEALGKGMNLINVTTADGRTGEVQTCFTFNSEEDILMWMRIASVDPRNYVGMPQDYTLCMPVQGGVDETALAIEAVFPDPKELPKTKDAYIDYEEMEIVPEVQGEDTDFLKVAKALEAQVNEEPAKHDFEYGSIDHVRTPEIRTGDLAEELKFAKYYLADGLKLDRPDGMTWTITPTQLSKVILYSEEGPKYSEEGAKQVAEEIAGEYSQDYRTVRTAEGDRTLLDYVIEDSVDVNRTGESIYKAAKQGKTGEIIINEAEARDLSTRAEVSISTQTVYFYQNGEQVFRSSCVTGSNQTPTPRGIFELQDHRRDVVLTGPNADGTTYRSPVSYWMPFNGGIGFHDATWRSSFGGSIYVNSGSHGCINMPYDKAAELYNLISVGTLVYVYD